MVTPDWSDHDREARDRAVQIVACDLGTRRLRAQYESPLPTDAKFSLQALIDEYLEAANGALRSGSVGRRGEPMAGSVMLDLGGIAGRALLALEEATGTPAEDHLQEIAIELRRRHGDVD